MTTESTQFELQAMQLFEASLDIPNTQRKEWVTAQTGTNTKLRDRVLQLLEKDAISENVMHTGKVDVDSESIDIPEKIGVYKITQLIGQGGMGAVYKGKRDSGDFEHNVAIKVIRTKVLSEQLIQRFERERQTLAQLIHPNIARLYDGGQTPQNMPYFIMEFIDGQPLTKWCEQQNLSDSKRIKLLIKACEAVRYAHQNLIIHRDLTPSNVLVDKAGDVKDASLKASPSLHGVVLDKKLFARAVKDKKKRTKDKDDLTSLENKPILDYFNLYCNKDKHLGKIS